MDSSSFANDTLFFHFTDEPRGETTRNGAGLASFESFNGTICIIYQTSADGLAGEERLLLPRSESYLEIVTPAGLPAFDGRALPDEAAYGARALNNLGADCNPGAHLMEETQCSSNGNPNPANGNLFYSVTDLEAFGSLFNLNVQRSYNSRAAVWDGPFGYGWDSLYRLDYNVPFNTETSSRPIIPGDYDYPVALELAWTPRGLLTYLSPTGSRYQFVLRETSPEGRELWQALAMPNWVLSRDGQWGKRWTMYTITASPSATATYTITASPSPQPTEPIATSTRNVSPTPAVRAEQILTNLGQVGSPNSFDCIAFNETYLILVQEVANNNPEYDFLASLVDEETDSLNEIYHQYCEREANNSSVQVDVILYRNMRQDLTEISR